ncbi:MAG TPA: type IV pilus modification protein PilV [Steroidobacteraceae bacterium]|nr:type IV pilus modification protein PilV [Steroidobacteraceae bacterium]
MSHVYSSDARAAAPHRFVRGGAAAAPGFTLVEVLVALVVLSIGLLGIGKLMLFSSRANDSAYMRTQATALAYMIMDDMRANRTQAIGGAYQIAFGAATNPGTNCDTATCTPAVLASYDLWTWQSQLASALPAGNGSVSIVSVPDTNTGDALYEATVTVQWNDVVAQQSFGAASATNSVVLETIL